MKTFAAICAMLLSIIGCASVRVQQNSFVSLHRLVKQRLGDSCDCGPIINNGVNIGRCFVVSPRPRGLRITVFERPFIPQKEWERRYTNVMCLVELPEWSYQNTGVDVGVQGVEAIYPGYEEDAAAAEECRNKIVKLLKPYHRANTSLEPTPTAP